MARARNIKPGFFTNDLLSECQPLARLLFQGLWCHADREGRIEDRPKKLKAEILPYDEADAETLLSELEVRGFVIRYESGGKRYLQVVNFCKHQNPHVKEQASEIPAPDKHDASTVQAPVNTGSCPADSLSLDSLIPHPSSLNPDSLIPDSETPKSKPLHPGKPAAEKKPALTADETALQAVCRETWQRYSEAYAVRYGATPIRNAKINGQVKQFCQRVPEAEAPAIAAFYVRHNASFYVGKGHAVGPLLADAEKLRTEWATNQTITATQAQQADKTQANGNVWGKVIAGIEERDRNAAVN